MRGTRVGNPGGGGISPSGWIG